MKYFNIKISLQLYSRSVIVLRRYDTAAETMTEIFDELKIGNESGIYKRHVQDTMKESLRQNWGFFVRFIS